MIRFISFVAALSFAGAAFGYPLDAYEETGMTRLEAYRLAQSGEIKKRHLPSGAFLSSEQIKLSLVDRPDFKIPAPDPEFNRKLASMLGSDAEHYGVALLDITDPDRPRYAEYNAGFRVNPGSVGKIAVGLGIFQTLADIYPNDITARQAVLKNTMETADDFIIHDHHEVPFWQPGETRVVKRAIRQGDSGNLWTFMDWMMSSSSNAAASMVIKNLVLMQQFGARYPAPKEEMEQFLATAPKKELSALLARGLQEPVTRNGLDLDSLRQGSFFTRQGKKRIPGTSSHATSRELMHFAVKMEQGKLVDPFSSLEIKKLLYLTDRRIRYASAPRLSGAAVYFKSGSLYQCKPEEGFTCRKYHGNVRNLMNSLAIVETHDRDPVLRYITVVTSNVLRKNSAVAHQTLAQYIHRFMLDQHPARSVAAVPAAAPVEAPAPVVAPVVVPAEPTPAKVLEVPDPVGD